MDDKSYFLHVVPDLHPSSGGTSRMVIDLVDELALQIDQGISLISQGLSGSPYLVPNNSSVRCILLETVNRFPLLFGFPVKQGVTQSINKYPPLLIHNHGLWLPVNHWVTQVALRDSVPLISQPHGMLEPWAMKQKAFKKRLAMTIFQRKDLEAANLLIATSEEEYLNFRRLGLHSPVAVVPNGVHLSVSNISSRLSSKAGVSRTVLFLSRIHPKKGLLNLVQAWATIKPENWLLKIAGPDEGGHMSEVITAIRKHGLESVVEYVGEVEGERKSYLYNNADLFVLPTFSENFGIVVAEALAHGVPVITTKGAPWSDIEDYGCGWWVDIGVEPLVHALRDAMALSDNERKAKGKRGIDYVKRYEWSRVASQMVDVYSWVLGYAPKPDSVCLD